MSAAEDYIRGSEISPYCEDKIISCIEKCVKINPLGGIDWYGMPDAILVENISEEIFQDELKSILKKVNSNEFDFYFIIQSDNSMPPLKSRIDCWLIYFNEFFYFDTIFLNANGRCIIHYDFYGNLWAKLIHPAIQVPESDIF